MLLQRTMYSVQWLVNVFVSHTESTVMPGITLEAVPSRSVSFQIHVLARLKSFRYGQTREGGHKS